MLADTLSRTALAPRQLPVGILTALIGVPLFLYLLYRGRGLQGADELPGRRVALHGGRVDNHRHKRKASPKNAQHVTHSRAAGRGDDADASR